MVNEMKKKKQMKAKQSATVAVAKPSFKKQMKKYWPYYVILALPILHLIIFKYVPMYGVQIAFKNYRIADGILGSDWVGMKHFVRFFKIGGAMTYIKNTLILSVYGLVAGFPFPIILALSLNYVKKMKFKKTVQMISYAPHFISTVVMVGMLNQFFSRTGLINNILTMMNLETVSFFGEASFFRSMYVWSGVWQGVGFSSILYLGILAGVDYTLHEAAIVDSANVLQRMWYIDFPAIVPTAITLLIMNTGHILSVGFEKVYLMQNLINLSVSEIISTYTYKMGFVSSMPDFGYTSAIGLFQSLVGLTLMLVVNGIANKVNDSGIF